MNENDKILINAYLDDELSPEEMKSIERLIASDNDANEYANKIKRASVEIDSYFESQDIKDLKLDIASFVNEIEFSKEKSSFSESIKNFFTPQSFVGYALTASFVYFVMLPVNEDVIEQSLFAEDFSSFGNETKNYYYEKYRGAEDLGDLSKDYIIQTINKMIESKTNNSVMSYGDDSYFIKLTDLTLNNVSVFCFDGYIYSDNSEREFLYCKSQYEETINFYH